MSIHIHSHVKEIDQLVIEPLPRYPVKGQCIHIDGLLLVKGDNGKLYASLKDKRAYLAGKYPWTEPIMKALVKMKVITPTMAEEHVARCEIANRKRRANSDLEYTAYLLKKWGLSLTEEQAQALRNVAETGELPGVQK